MNIHKFWQSRKIFLASIILLLSACSEEMPDPIAIQNGFYLPENISIEYAENDQVSREAQNQASNSVREIMNQTYFEIKDRHFIVYTTQSDDTGLLTPENIAILPNSSYILDWNDNNDLTASSQDFDLCKTLHCTINFVLKNVSADDPHIASIENFAQEAIHNNAPIAIDIPEAEIQASLSEPFWGVVHAITDELVLKLSPAQSNGLIYGVPGHTELMPFQLGGVAIDPKDENIEVLSFYTNDEPSSTVHQVNTYSYLFIMPTSEPLKINLSKIRPEDYRYLSLENGFIAEDSNGFYAINYYFFPKIGKSVIALTEGVELDEVIHHFRSLQTLKNKIAADNNSLLIVPYEISLQDFKLALSTLENRYNMRLDQLFRVDQITQNYKDEITRIIESPALFIKTGPSTHFGYHRFVQPLGDYHFNETFIRIHHNDIKSVIKAVRAANHQENGEKTTHDLWISPIYVYSIQPNEASGLSYFKEIQPGVTLEIFSPASQGHTAEKVLFGKMLQQFNVTDLPKIAAEAIANIGKYTVMGIDAPQSAKETQDTHERARSKVTIDHPAVDTTQPEVNPADNDAILNPYMFQEGEVDQYGRLLHSESSLVN